MNKKIFNLLGMSLLGIILTIGFATVGYCLKRTIRIGILMPIEHAALREIVAGFEKVVGEAFPNSVSFNVQSAQGDIKLQRSIIELFVGQKVDMIVPIGTTVTQMTLSLVKEQPIVSLAALYSEKEREQRYPRNITGVLDEIGGKKKLDFVRAILPTAQTITLIVHSADEKNHAEIEQLKAYSKELGITLQLIMVQNLPDLETAAHSIVADSKAILILKDHMIASGIRMLVPITKNRGIPLITADEGTVQEGATLALGVRERMIGEAGGKLAVQILKGYPIQDLPMQELKELAIFYNKAAYKQQAIDFIRLQDYARQQHYELVGIAATGR